MKISPTRIGTVLILTVFAFMNIHCGGKVVDPNAPRILKEFSAQGESSTKQTDDDPGQITVVAECDDDYPVLFKCKKWWAESGITGDNPFKMKGPDGAKKSKTENACVCEGRHAPKTKDFFGINNHYIKCGVTAVCANK